MFVFSVSVTWLSWGVGGASWLGDGHLSLAITHRLTVALAPVWSLATEAQTGRRRGVEHQPRWSRDAASARPWLASRSTGKECVLNIAITVWQMDIF